VPVPPVSFMTAHLILDLIILIILDEEHKLWSPSLCSVVKNKTPWSYEPVWSDLTEEAFAADWTVSPCNRWNYALSSIAVETKRQLKDICTCMLCRPHSVVVDHGALPPEEWKCNPLCHLNRGRKEGWR
jgi:hypothetical protein